MAIELSPRISVGIWHLELIDKTVEDIEKKYGVSIEEPNNPNPISPLTIIKKGMFIKVKGDREKVSKLIFAG